MFMKSLSFKSKSLSDWRGFSLPTVIIISLVTLAALVTTMSAITVTRSAINDQYYNKMARDAALSGIERASACIKSNSNYANWSDAGKSLTPGTNCDGSTNSSASNYIMQNDSARTTFSVGSVTTTAGFTTIKAEGVTELLRKSDGSVWESYRVDLSRKVSVAALVSTKASIGYYQVCGILDAKTWCWGRNGSGQLGDGTTNDSTVPVQVERHSGVLQGRIDTEIAVGDSFACTISSNEVYCWGANSLGELGNGTTTDSRYPVKVDHSTGLAGKTLTEIVATESTACVVASGEVYCWGESNYGQLGIGVRGTTRTRPVRVDVIGASRGLPVTKISTTPQARHICAIASARAYCWGGNQNGEIGNRQYLSSGVLVPTAVSTTGTDGLGSRTVTDISAGGYEYGSVYYGHSCAVASGDAFCWGSNIEFEVNPVRNDSDDGVDGGYYNYPVRMSSTLPSGQIIQIGAGYDFSCALATGNRVWCWGWNHWGQLGDGTFTNRRYPTPLATAGTPVAGKPIERLTVGVLRGCVLSEGRTYCWGSNDAGQLGDGTRISRPAPVEASFLRNTSPQITY